MINKIVLFEIGYKGFYYDHKLERPVKFDYERM